MKITKTLNGKKLNVALEGRMDTNTAPELEAALKEHMNEIEELNIDMRSEERRVGKECM